MSLSKHTIRRSGATIGLLCVLLISGLFRLFYARAFPPTIAPDTYGYNSVGYRIISGQEPVLSDERPPVYPLLLAFTAKLLGRSDDRLDTRPFQQAAILVTFLQTLFGLTTTILVFYLATSLGLPDGWAIMASFLVGTNIMIFGWERQLITESPATLLLILIAFLGLKLVDKPNRKITYSLVILFIVAFLLKPVFLILPIIFYPCIFWIVPKARRLSLVSFVCFLVVVSAYVSSNLFYYQYPGINHVTDVNAFGKILTLRLPLPVGVRDNPFTKSFISYQNRGGAPDPYLFLWDYDPTFLTRTNNIAELNQFRQFTNGVVSSNLFPYLTASIAEIPRALTATDLRLIPNPAAPFAPLWQGLFILFSWVQSIYILMLLLLPLALRRKQVMVVGVITLAFLFSTTFGGYGEFYRLLSPLQPLLITLTIWCIYQIGMVVEKHGKVLLVRAWKHCSEKGCIS